MISLKLTKFQYITLTISLSHDDRYHDKEEAYVIKRIEAPAARLLEGEDLRECHCGTFFDAAGPTTTKAKVESSGEKKDKKEDNQ